MNRLFKTFVLGIMAGVMIGIGGTVFLACESKIAGALMFCVGLFAICTFGLRLYTGRVGYVLDSMDFGDLVATWLGNLVGTLLIGIGVAAAKPAIGESAATLCAAKLQQTIPAALLLGFLCGVLMYVAVDAYKRYADAGFLRCVGILLGVPAFILCGFEHSIADMFYFAAGGRFVEGLGYLLLISAGNALGALAFHWSLKFAAEKQK